MPQLAIIADDLTGAADSSAAFANAGYSTVIPLFDNPAPPADVVVLTTESRDMEASAAARVTREAVIRLVSTPGERGPRWIYKKIDSALRGHPRDELLAAMEAAGAMRAIVAPALPAEGRATIGGRQYVDGVPLEESHFGRPGAVSDLRHVFANDRGLPVQHLDLAAIRGSPAEMQNLLESDVPGIVIADAETDDDLTALAQAVSACRPCVLCGAAGFASALARTLPLTASVSRPAAARNAGGPILVVAGSKHEATRRQLAALARAGIPSDPITQHMIDDPMSSVAEVVSDVAAMLARDAAAAVTTVGLAPSSSDERVVAARLAEVVATPAIVGQIGGLVLTGGDVAAAVCKALGATAIWLGGEIYAGQPWGLLEGGLLPGLPVATKAGSFGGENAFIRCIEYLQSALAPGRSSAITPGASPRGL